MSTNTFNFSARCFWSIMRSLSIFGETKFMIDIVHRKMSNPIDTTEMHAPDTVP